MTHSSWLYRIADNSVQAAEDGGWQTHRLCLGAMPIFNFCITGIIFQVGI